MAQNDVYQIKVTLKHSKPPIWRRIEVPGNMRLDKLHRILQATMGWWDAHLHQFVVNGNTFYGVPHPDDWEEVHDEKKVRLDQLVREVGSKLIYEYDFGDSWEHELLVEKIIPPEANVVYPRCIKGRRACPPEDVGGVWGYADFVAAIKDPNHPEHNDMLTWVGDNFDPEVFDLAEVDEALRHV